MSKLFVDTSGWGNLVDHRQPFHGLASQIYLTARQQNQKIITTNYIITELVALMTSPLYMPKSLIIEFIDSIKTSPYVEIHHLTNQDDEQAWLLLKNRQDKLWSIVDCASFVIMRHKGIAEALTNDHHFEQAGFIRLLK